MQAKDDVKQHDHPDPKTIQKTVPCICTNSKAEFSENLRPEGNLQFEKLGFWCLPVDEKPKCIENAAFVKEKKEVCCSIVLYSSSRWSQKAFSAFSIPVTVSLSHQCHYGCKHTILGCQPAFFWSADFFREVLKVTQCSFNVGLNPVTTSVQPQQRYYRYSFFLISFSTPSACK